MSSWGFRGHGDGARGFRAEDPKLHLAPQRMPCGHWQDPPPGWRPKNHLLSTALPARMGMPGQGALSRLGRMELQVPHFLHTKTPQREPSPCEKCGTLAVATATRLGHRDGARGFQAVDPELQSAPQAGRQQARPRKEHSEGRLGEQQPSTFFRSPSEPDSLRRQAWLPQP